MLSKKLPMTLLLVAAALGPLTCSYHLTRDEDDPLDFSFLHDAFSSVLRLQNLEHNFGRRELRGNEIDLYAERHNLEPVIERRTDPVHTVQLTYHKAQGLEEKNTWTGEGKIGKTIYNLEFSTGSSDLWVTTGTTVTYRDCQKKITYSVPKDALESIVRKTQDKRMDGHFVPQHGVDRLFQDITNGKVTTTRRRDTVKIGGITVKRHVFGTVKLSYTMQYFCRLPFDGILGLAFPALAVDHLDPFLVAALGQEASSGFTSGIFAFHLTKGSGSELHIGGTGDPSLFEEDSVEYHDILELEYNGKKPSYWVIGDGKIKVGEKTIASGISTIIDTGTDMILGDIDRVVDFYVEMSVGDFAPTPPTAEAQIDYVLPCNMDDKRFPKISFSWGANGQEWTIDRESFTLSPLDESGATCRGAVQMFRPVRKSETSFRKESALETSYPQSTTPSTKPWVLGTSFLMNLYPIFNIKDKKVGFARRKQKDTHRLKIPLREPPQRQLKHGHRDPESEHRPKRHKHK